MLGWVLWTGLALAQQDAVAPATQPREAYRLAVLQCVDASSITGARPPDPSGEPVVEITVENQGTATCTWPGLALAGGLAGAQVLAPADTSRLVLAPGGQLLLRIRPADPAQLHGDAFISVPANGGALTIRTAPPAPTPTLEVVQPDTEPVGGIGGLIPASGAPLSFDGLRATPAGGPPITTAGIPTVSGQDSKLVEATVARQISSIRYCYQRELQRSPALAGEITVAFTIAADGTVPSAEISASSLNSRAVEECIVGRFLRMQFPAPSGGSAVKATYPFTFNPG